MTYLITDDSKMARRMTMKILENFTTKDDLVLQATNGAEAVEIYKEHEPDLCFMDLTMPVLDGFEATLQIKKINPNAKVIVLSADVQQKAIEKAQMSGAIGFINKPIDYDKMKGVLLKLGIVL